MPLGSAADTRSSLLDLRKLLVQLNPNYLSSSVVGPRYTDRIQTLYYAASLDTLFVVIGERFVFAIDERAASPLREIAEVNYLAGQLVPAGRQYVDSIVETLSGTVLLIGRDNRDGVERGVVWRREPDDEKFRRASVSSVAWQSSKAGNAAAGFFGCDREELVAIAPYASPAHIYTSRDDGLTWRHHTLGHLFADHAHEVYLPRAVHPNRCARLWVTGGDDPSGERSGLVYFDGFKADGDLGEGRFAFRERPGYRLVGLAGNGREIYVGNESLAGGVLKLQDNEQSILAGDFEYVLAKSRHDYHQMRSLVATPDGLLVSGTDSYGHVGDNIRADSGGYLYVSTDEGASCRTIPLGAKWITGIAYDGRAFWVATSMGREEGGDFSSMRLTLMRIEKPSVLSATSDDFVVKLLIADSSEFYRAAGYASHPAPVLGVGEATLRVDMAPFRSIALLVESRGRAELAIESIPFRDWDPRAELWSEVQRVVMRRAGRHQALVPSVGGMSRFFRVRNVGRSAALLRQLAFIGRK